MTENTKTEFKCQCCDSNFTRSYNLKRHMERKHAQQKVIISPDKVIIPQQKVIISKDKVIIPQQKVIISELDTFSCKKCERVFKKQWICTRHEKKCSSTINPLECTFCHKIYSTKQSKFVHMKKCKDQAIVLYNNSDADANANTNTAQSLVTNNITNNNINNTNNINNGTINYNIVIYDEKKTNFIKEHITYEKLKFLLNTNTDETVFSKYNNHLMEKEENNCIRKSDKRSNYSQIHIGENKWKNIPDKKIYPEIISQIAGDMQDIVNDKFENLKSK